MHAKQRRARLDLTGRATSDGATHVPSCGTWGSIPHTGYLAGSSKHAEGRPPHVLPESMPFLLLRLLFSARIGPVRLTTYPTCSASFFSRNNIFLSQHFSQNSIFQPISAKIQQAERGLFETTQFPHTHFPPLLSRDYNYNLASCSI